MEKSSCYNLIMFCMVLVMVVMATTTTATIQDDEKDCADQLANLAACIPFVSGTANKPTPECCEDTRKVRSAKPKCLCVLIKESTDPSMGLPINTTLALQMPAACSIDAKPSDCPTLLNIPADSPDAKIFKDVGGGSGSTNAGSGSTSTGSSASATPTVSSTTTPSGTDKSSDTKPATSTSSGSEEVKLGESLLIKIAGLVTLAWVLA